MKNENFIMMLPDTIQKSSIIEQSRVIRKELEDSTISVYNNAKGVFVARDLSTYELTDLQKTYERLSGRKQCVIDDIEQALPKLVENLKAVEEIAQKSFGETLVKSSISVREINVLQFISLASFISRYARKLLAYFYACESATFKESSLKVKESFSKADLKYINGNFIDFINALGSLSIDDRKLEQILKSLPDIRVGPDNARSIFSLQSNSKIDPLRMQNAMIGDVTRGLHGLLFSFMMRWAERQADAYKLALEEKRMLEYRLLLLKRQREGKTDAKLEKEIAVIEDRIARLAYKIQREEEDNA